MLIEAIPFTSVGKLQPFLLTITSSSLLLADFHCHLTVREVCGYLGGTWDMNTHSESGLKIIQNFSNSITKSIKIDLQP